MRNYFLIAGFCLLVVARAAANWVSQNPQGEFLVSGDFNADGFADVAVADPALGVVRIAMIAAGGGVQTSLVAVTGVDDVEGVTAGRLIFTNRDSIAFTGPSASRINVVTITNIAAASPAFTLFPVYAIGLNQVLAIDIGGATNNPAIHDYFSATRLNTVSNPWVYESSRNQTSQLYNLSNGFLAGEHVRGNRVKLSSSGPELAAFVEKGGTDKLRFLALTNGAPVLKLEISSLATGTHYACGFFSATGTTAHLITYVPGRSNFNVYAVNEPSPVTYTASLLSTVQVGFAMASIVTVPGTNHLVISRIDGSGADVVSLVPGSGISLIRQMTPPVGAAVMGAVARAGGFAVLYGGADERTAGIESFAATGGTYAATGSAALPLLSSVSGRANVWTFANEPLVSTSPQLKTALNAADWSSGFRTSGVPAAITVTGEVDTGSATGLRSPSNRGMGAMPSGAAYGMVNQVQPYVSMVSFEPASGPQPGSVAIAPAPGYYDHAIKVSFTSSPSLYVVYRIGLDKEWTLYSAPFWIYEADTIYYYAASISTNQITPLGQAAYSFNLPPEQQDADGDSVPDFVEIDRGLDPVDSGDDADGDGLTDLEELLGGYTLSNRLDRGAAFDLRITPRPHAAFGTGSSDLLARTNTENRVYGLDGAFYGFGLAQSNSIAGLTNPSVIIRDLPLSMNPPLLVYATEEYYPLSTTTNRHGRELISIVPLPAAPVPAPIYVYGGAGQAAEASNWVSAATSVWRSLVQPVVQTQAAYEHVLAAALLERKISQLLVARGVTTNQISTLFPWRSLEGGAYAPSMAGLAALQTRTTNGWTAYRVASVYTSILQSVLSSPTIAITNLRIMARNVYRVSSTNESGYALPFDAIRQFVRTGALPGAYSNTVGMSTSSLAWASMGVADILNSVTGRPYVTLSLAAREPTNRSCTVLYETTTGAPYQLVNADGSPYDLARTFAIISGTVFSVSGFTDVTASGCVGTAIEVDAVNLLSFIMASPRDLNGNLLDDDWELLAFGVAGSSHTNDADGDGFCDLQEYLDGTDPRNFVSRSAAAEDFSLPEVFVAITGTVVNLNWYWPTNYLNRFQFAVQSSSTLNTNFSTRTVITGDNDAMLTGETSATSRFYRIGISVSGSADPGGDGI